MQGTWINAAAILVGSLAGLLLSRRARRLEKAGNPPAEKLSIMQVMGIFLLILGFQGVKLIQSGSQFVFILVLVLAGGWLGHALRLEARIEALSGKIRGDWGKSFVTSSVLFCVGPMAILGSLQDGIQHNPSILISKAVLDCVMATALTTALGLGVALSAAAVLIYQGGMSLLAHEIQAWVSPQLLECISASGGVLLLFSGFNLIGVTRIQTANFLPGLILAAALSRFYS